MITPQRKYELKYPDRRRAHGRINDRIRRGRMPRADTQQCVDCGMRARDYDHFLGYDSDAVEAVCRPCHYDREKVRRRLIHLTLFGHEWTERLISSTSRGGCATCEIIRRNNA